MALARLPGSVLRAIEADALCDFVWLCSRHSGTRDVLRLSDIREASVKPFPPASEDWQLVYDVMRVHRGSIVFAQDHMQRIAKNCATSAGAVEEMDIADISRAISDYIRLYPCTSEDVNIKFITWLPPRGCAAWLPRLEFAVYFIRSFFPPAHWYRTGTRLALLYDAQRVTPNVKTVQSELRARAAALQSATGTYEVLLVWDRAGHFLVPEGSRSNYILATRDGQLLCSREEDILVGVTLRAARRTSAVASAVAPAVAVAQRALAVGDICAAAGLALLGTSPGVLPVAEIVLFSDAGSRRAFEEALQAYDERAAPDGAVYRAAREAGERALAGDGVLRLDSAANEMLTRLRVAYEAEAFGGNRS